VSPLADRTVCIAPAALSLPLPSGVTRVCDAGEGPLSAIVAAAREWPAALTLVSAADQPFLDAALLIALRDARGDAVAVAPQRAGALEPLPVWLDAVGLAALSREHAAGERSLARALQSIGVRAVRADALPGGAAALATRADAERARARTTAAITTRASAMVRNPVLSDRRTRYTSLY
ncbi:MAG TPA: NTP transferase domain-containing protein, partial [Promineifilum sp.]|nr:NTP transferase domain-containing protein [Promineifilum sp.]